MKASELRSLDDAELIARLKDLKIELAKERAMIASGTRPEKPTKVRNIRKDIARILTVMNQKGNKQTAMKIQAEAVPKKHKGRKVIKNKTEEVVKRK